MKSKSKDHPDSVYDLMVAALQEIVGEPALDNALQSDQNRLQSGASRSPLADVQAALEAFYGRQGGKGLALQAGRCAFNALLSQYGSEIGLQDNPYRMLPTPKRIPSGLLKIAKKLGDLGVPPVVVAATDTAWVWKTSDCMFKEAGDSEEPGCSFIVGMLQEYLSWASGGKYFPLRETDCVRSGDACCIIRINKIPLD